MADIRIVEYETKWAKAVADMWNKSQDNWGGGSAVRTEEQVLQQEANSSNLHLYLAVDGDEVVGYCGLSEYKGDEGALYIPLLNVRSDYHGKKIGKKLVLKAVERTIQLGWPRLDLYTWPGNTKAVPLYKKCGFFWEEDDRSTHLMNYIPTVLNTELIQDYFNKADWYSDSTREIEVKPDGRKENGFDFFGYSWESKDGEKLRVEFERKSRGMRLIETEDFFISASTEHLKRIIGKRHTVLYEIVNKTGKPLEVSLQGVDDKNIMFRSFAKSLNVVNREIVKGEFEVGRLDEEQSPKKTHPAVVTDITINGKQARFKTAVLSKFPANTAITLPGTQAFIGVEKLFYLEMENNMKERATFSFSLPEQGMLQFEKPVVEVSLNEGEKKSIPVPYRLKQFGFYDPQVAFQVTPENGEGWTFKKKITAAFKGLGAKFSGESEDYWQIYNGSYHLLLEKNGNGMLPGQKHESEDKTAWFFPKLGKPFSDELSRVRPESVNFHETDQAIVMEAFYRSEAFKNVGLTVVAKLFAEGVVERNFTITNLSEHDSVEALWLHDPIYYELKRPVMAYNHEILTVEDPADYFHEYWDGSKVTGNWLFSRHSEGKGHGLSWAKEDKVHFEDWYVYFEHPINTLAPGEKYETRPTLVSIGAFHDWRDFKAFAEQSSSTVEQDINPTLDVKLTVNDDNPVITSDSAAVEWTDFKSTFLDGVLTISENGTKLAQKNVKPDEKQNALAVNVELSDDSGIHLINGIGDWKTRNHAISTAVLRPSNEKVETTIIEREGKQSYEASNGILTIKAAPEFFPVMYALEYEGHNWLHHSFPQAVPKSWWNPWPGGMLNRHEDMNLNSIDKEKHHAAFSTLRDHKGNEWSGIAVTTEVTNHEKLKGLSYTQYYLMIPGVPVVCHTTEIHQQTNRYLKANNWIYDLCIASDVVKMQNQDGHWMHLKSFQGEFESFVESALVYEKRNRREKLQVAADFDLFTSTIYTNKEVNVMDMSQVIDAEDGKSFFTKPVFFLMTEEQMPAQSLKSLGNLKF
ncbi:MAG TPA: GNAT family N-acetyltransferase [Bacillales bacterium]|nr:GNAT family N-acetyltransferase [Bacillales bacterium]